MTQGEAYLTHDHCWHDQSKEGKAKPGDIKEICCQCGEVRSRKTRLVTPAGHGEYAPKTIEYDPEQEEAKPYEPEEAK